MFSEFIELLARIGGEAVLGSGFELESADEGFLEESHDE